MDRPGSSALQVNVAFERRDGSARASARALFGRLAPLLEEWRQRAFLKRFFFMRKPPDLRLRFLETDPAALSPELEKLLSGLQDDGFVERFFPSVYEPEVLQFGGPEAMDHVHAHFDADSAAWIALDRLDECGRRTVPVEVLTTAVMNDLFYRTLSCGAEVWDVWCNLKSLAPAAETTSDPVDIVLVENILPQVSSAEADILEQYVRSNQELATGLLQVWNEGKLQCGLRALLPFVAMFHFNRHGLGGIKQAALAQAMSQAWNPKRGLRGAEAGPAPKSERVADDGAGSGTALP